MIATAVLFALTAAVIAVDWAAHRHRKMRGTPE